MRAEIDDTSLSLLSLSTNDLEDVSISTEQTDGGVIMYISGSLELAGRSVDVTIDEDDFLNEMMDSDLCEYVGNNLGFYEVADHFADNEVEEFVKTYNTENGEDVLTAMSTSEIINELLGREDFSIGVVIDKIIAQRIGAAIVADGQARAEAYVGSS